MDEHTTHNTRTTRLLLDVTWDPDVEDKPTTWQWNHGIEPRATDSIVVVGEVTGRDDELLTVLEELRDAMNAECRKWRVAKHPDDPEHTARNHGKADGLYRARRMVQDAINEHTPEPRDPDGEDLSPARPVSHRDAITALALEATDD